MENHIRSALESFSNALEMIRAEEMDRYKKQIKNVDRDRLSLVSSIIMAEIIRKLETNLVVANKKGKSKNLTQSLEKIFSSSYHPGTSQCSGKNDFTNNVEKRC